jgi:hypothetical protein
MVGTFLWRIPVRIAAVLALLFGFALASPAPSQASVCSHLANGYCFDEAGWQTGTSSIYGIDGYIRSSTTVPVAANTHRTDWINVCPSPCSNWVQVGAYQGQVGSLAFNPSTTRIYAEEQRTCAYYAYDQGAAINANEAYYLTYSGTVSTGLCGTQYLWTVRKGSFNSSPIRTLALSVSHGYGLAKSELAWPQSGSVPPANTTYFGVDSSFNPDISKGLHLQYDPGGVFVPFNTTNEPNASYGSDVYRVLHTTQYYWSFKVD